MYLGSPSSPLYPYGRAIGPVPETEGDGSLDEESEDKFVDNDGEEAVGLLCSLVGMLRIHQTVSYLLIV